MTEYDFSPEAYERHIATQNRIANWVGKTEEHRPQFGNALMVPPSAKSTSFNEADTTPQRPSYRRHHSSDALGTYVTISGTNNIHAPDMEHRSNHRSQPQSRSSSRHRSSSKHHATSPTYVVAVPQASSRTYVCAPPGWVPSQGLVIVSSSGRDLNLVLSPPAASPPQLYQSSNLGPAVPATYTTQSTYPPTMYHQAVPPGAGYPHAPMYSNTPGPSPYLQAQGTGQVPLQPQMMYQQSSNTTVESGRGGRKIKKVKRSKSEVWFRR